MQDRLVKLSRLVMISIPTFLSLSGDGTEFVGEIEEPEIFLRIGRERLRYLLGSGIGADANQLQIHCI